MEGYFFLSFDSTSYALQAESFLKKNDFSITIIPTPREVSESCGLSIKLNSGGIDTVKEIVDQGKIRVKGIYHLIRENGERKVEKMD
jgi:hypothetical protein